MRIDFEGLTCSFQLQESLEGDRSAVSLRLQVQHGTTQKLQISLHENVKLSETVVLAVGTKGYITRCLLQTVN